MTDTVRKDYRGGGGGSENSTMNTSMSTLISDPQDIFHHSITDLDSFSTSLDFDRHLPSVEASEDFLSNLMDEEEINPDDSFQSSFAYDMERSIPARLGTILDQANEEDEDEDDEEAAEAAAAAAALSKSTHQQHNCTGESAATKA